MQAGRMKFKLELLEPVLAGDKFGAKKKSEYRLKRTVWAERVKIRGSRREEVGELFADYRAEFNIRDVHPVKENWRVKQLGGNTYTVTNIIYNLDRGMKTLVCERVNE